MCFNCLVCSTIFAGCLAFDMTMNIRYGLGQKADTDGRTATDGQITCFLHKCHLRVISAYAAMTFKRIIRAF